MSIAKIEVTTSNFPTLIQQANENHAVMGTKLFDSLNKLDSDVRQAIKSIKDDNSDPGSLDEQHESFSMQLRHLKELATISEDLVDSQRPELEKMVGPINDRISNFGKLLSSQTPSVLENSKPTLSKSFEISHEISKKIALAIQRGFLELTKIFTTLKAELQSTSNDPMLVKIKLVEAKSEKLKEDMQKCALLTNGQKNIFNLYFNTCATSRAFFLSNWTLALYYKKIEKCKIPDLYFDRSDLEKQIDELLAHQPDAVPQEVNFTEKLRVDEKEGVKTKIKSEAQSKTPLPAKQPAVPAKEASGSPRSKTALPAQQPPASAKEASGSPRSKTALPAQQPPTAPDKGGHDPLSELFPETAKPKKEKTETRSKAHSVGSKPPSIEPPVLKQAAEPALSPKRTSTFKRFSSFLRSSSEDSKDPHKEERRASIAGSVTEPPKKEEPTPEQRQSPIGPAQALKEESKPEVGQPPIAPAPAEAKSSQTEYFSTLTKSSVLTGWLAKK